MVVGICDDELMIREELVRFCKSYMQANSMSFEIICFSSGEEVIGYEKALDILFLDIQMGGMDGMQTAEQLRMMDNSVTLIFLTGYVNYMQAGYRVRAFRYLLKPVNRQEFKDALSDAVEDIKKDSRIIVGSEGETIFLKLKDIIYIEYVDRHTVIRTRNDYFQSFISMNDWENNLNSCDFYRVHKSYIVNLEFIKEIGKEIVLDNEEKVEVSVRKIGALKKACKAYRRRNAR